MCVGVCVCCLWGVFRGIWYSDGGSSKNYYFHIFSIIYFPLFLKPNLVKETIMSEGSKQAAFTEKMSKVIAEGYLCLALAVGHTAGLFNALATFDEPKTCEEIATASGCKQRYC